MSYRLVLTCGFSAAVMVAACSGEDDASDTDATGGAGGEGPVGCSTDGTGTIDILVSGLPDDVLADVVVAGDSISEPITAATTLEDWTTGDYTVTAERVLDNDPIVRTVYEPVIEEQVFCLANDSTRVITVRYEALPSSNKLWTSNLVAFPSSELSGSGDRTPIVIDAPAGRDIAFDRDGNLWAFGATLAEPQLVRFPVSVLGTAGQKEWDIGFNVPDIACIPAVRALALAGPDLWVAVCGEELMKFSAATLDSGDLTPDVTISGMSGNQDIATNALGLWVATGTSLLLYETARLDADSSDPADLTITVRDAEDTRDLDPTGITFDGDGNLWGFCFGSNTIFKVGAIELGQTGEQTVIADVSFVLGVEVLVATGAFDDGKGLWVSQGGGRLGRLSPAQLTVSSGSGDPVTPERVVTSDALLSELNLAFFAAPAGVPLAPEYD